MGKLQAALDWARRGFRVFPLQYNTKKPVGIAFSEEATTDPEQIRKWWTGAESGEEQDWNIGFCTTGFIVLDIDVKQGKKGLESFAALALEFDTLTCLTPSGGYHLIYSGDAGQSPLAGKDGGIDVRSRNGYIAAPGSTIDGVEYKVCIDQPVLAFPEHLRPKLARVTERAPASEPEFGWDRPEDIAIAVKYLEHDAPVAVQNENGDDTTFKVLCKLRDFGISEATAWELAADYYNLRCEPPWPYEELRKKVRNAYGYAKLEAGASSPAASFGGVKIIEPRVASEVAPTPFRANGHAYSFGNLISEEDIIPRPWVLGTALLSGVVTTVVAAGGAGKSLLGLTIAAHLAVGKDFLGWKCFKPGKSIIYNAEDELPEQSRRLNAICAAYGLDREKVKASVALIDRRMLGLRVVNKSVEVNQEQVAALVAAASAPDVVLVILDPLVKLHSANENDNIEMDYVMEILSLVASTSECAMMVMHHTGKPPVASSNAWAGQQFAGRGASSVPAAARIVLTLFPAASDDCEDIGILPRDRHLYVRVDGAKSSHSAPMGQPCWLRWHTRDLRNGDQVGVLLEHKASDTAAETDTRISDAIFDDMARRGGGALTMEQAAAALRRADALGARESDSAVRARLVRIFERGVPTPAGTLRLSKDGGTKVIVIEH